jgi:hypothetical protein
MTEVGKDKWTVPLVMVKTLQTMQLLDGNTSPYHHDFTLFLSQGEWSRLIINT